ncbi:LytTR family DNA-binding domain-containing protein [Dyella jiangningensis]|uniref:LytTR family DNA-binding domain-containing protein n=1 Tax=Dyella jiangningensis TaxID=1379159 RepID=UPI00240EE391|nr:LytTR family DNA-binding domain-containing protein [Dyella jiangningensis]MDG2540016.1 LytTR family DNA-binding domain-containing protein [Dyella jiangningensis]
MTTRTVFDYQGFQRWRRPFEVGYWVVMLTGNTVFNGLVSWFDHVYHSNGTSNLEPWIWEASSSLVLLALIPFVVWATRRWPLRFDTWLPSLKVHLLLTVPFCLVHVCAMVGLRMLAYLAMGSRYRFGDVPVELFYEYLKDFRTYLSFVGLISFYGFFVRRLQGEASLLAEPDEGPPVEPVDRPERFLVRKLGKEFLVAARDIEWLQASGNYVNLRVRGRDYPLRATMAGIEERLDPARFVRVHRSYLVNLDYLAEIEPLETGDARLTLRDGASIPCSRRYRTQLRERFGDTAVGA